MRRSVNFSVIILGVVLRLAAAKRCISPLCPSYSILKQQMDYGYVNANMFKNWPKDVYGMQHYNPICPAGYTCIPNFLHPKNRGPVGPRRRRPQRPPYHRYKPYAHRPTTPPGGGCLGLDKNPAVVVQTYMINTYMGPCNNCGGTKPISTSSWLSKDSPDARWRLEVVGAHCAIRNPTTGLYGSRCGTCRPGSVDALFFWKSNLSDLSSDELWTVERNKHGNYLFKSVSTGKYLSVCYNCAGSTDSRPYTVTVHSTSPDVWYSQWGIYPAPNSNV